MGCWVRVKDFRDRGEMDQREDMGLKKVLGFSAIEVCWAVEDTEKRTSQSHGAVFFCSSPPNSLQWRRTQQASNPFFTIITSTSNIIGKAKLKGMLLQPKLNHFLNEIGFLSGFGWGFQALCFRPHLNSHSTDTCRRRVELLLFWRSEDRYGGGRGGCNQIGSETLLNQLKN